MKAGGAAIRPAAWIMLETAVGLVGSVLTTFLVARLIGPEAMGLAALAAAVVMLVQPAAHFPLTNALVQLPDLDQADIEAAFWATLAAALLLTAVLVAAGLLIGGPVGALLAALALVLPACAVEGVANGVLMRRMNQRALALRTVAAHAAALAAGIGFALQGAGPWAVVAQQIAFFTVSAAVSALAVPLRPRLGLQPARLARMRRFAVAATLGGVVLRARARLFLLLVAAPDPLLAGLLQIALRLGEMAQELSGPILHRTILPLLSRVAHDPVRRQRRAEAGIILAGLIGTPVAAGLALVAAPLTAVLLGPAWAGIVVPVQIIACAQALVASRQAIAAAMVAVGQPGRLLPHTLAGLLLALLAALLIRPQDAASAALCYLPAIILPSLGPVGVIARALGVGVGRQAGLALLALLPSVAMAAVLLAVGPRLGLQAAAQLAVMVLIAMAVVLPLSLPHALRAWRTLHA